LCLNEQGKKKTQYFRMKTAVGVNGTKDGYGKKEKEKTKGFEAKGSSSFAPWEDGRGDRKAQREEEEDLK